MERLSRGGLWLFYTVKPTVADQWRAWVNEFLDPARIQSRLALCKPKKVPVRSNQE
jgi:hypothetical protein